MIAAADKEKAQYTFDVMASHLLTQGKRSMAVIPGKISTRCAYRGEDGVRCVVGFCIKDEKYTPDLETLGANNPEVIAAIDDSYWKEKGFLCDMQMIHDLAPISEWPERLKSKAQSYNLDSSIVDTFTNITIPQPEVLVYEEV